MDQARKIIQATQDIRGDVEQVVCQDRLDLYGWEDDGCCDREGVRLLEHDCGMLGRSVGSCFVGPETHAVVGLQVYAATWSAAPPPLGARARDTAVAPSLGEPAQGR